MMRSNRSSSPKAIERGAVAAQTVATNHPTVATPVTTSHTNGQNGARLRALVKCVGWAGRFGLVITEFETQAIRVYSQRTF